MNSNVVENITIVRNTLVSSSSPSAMRLYGGESGIGPAIGNGVRKLAMIDNNVRSIQYDIEITGGTGMEAASNIVEWIFLNNGFPGNPKRLKLSANANGASSNVILAGTSLLQINSICLLAGSAIRISGWNQYGLACKVLASELVGGAVWLDVPATMERGDQGFDFLLQRPPDQRYYRVLGDFK